jgi:hypothetical protein
MRPAGVVGIKVFVYEIGSGLVEVMAIGTAIKKYAQVATESDPILPQSIIRDRDTFFDETSPLGQPAGQPRRLFWS